MFAWTECEGYKHYPRYVNIQQVEAGLRIAIRGPEHEGKNHIEAGGYAEVILPLAEIERLIAVLKSSEREG